MSSEDGSFNAFNNDGSFLERFRRMQEKGKQEQTGHQSSSPEKGTMTTSSFMPATLTSKRVTKSGAVVMKLSGVKKKTDQGVKLLKKPPAALGDSSSEDEGDTDKKGKHFSAHENINFTT